MIQEIEKCVYICRVNIPYIYSHPSICIKEMICRRGSNIHFQIDPCDRGEGRRGEGDTGTRVPRGDRRGGGISAGYAVLVEKAGHFLEKAGHFRKMPGFFSIGQVLVV